MKLVLVLVISSCALIEARGHPRPIFSSSGDFDTWSYGDGIRSGMVLTRTHDPYRRAVRGSPITFSLRQPESELPPLTPLQVSQYHQAVQRRQALLEVNDTPPQENEIYYPDEPIETAALVPIETTDLIQPVEQASEAPTTVKALVPEVVEPAVEEPQEEPVPQPKKATKKTPTKTPVDEEDDEDDSYPTQPKFPAAAFFPMFFRWSGSGSGATAVANAYSTGRGGAAASNAVAYGNFKPSEKV